ncbi:Wzz/FepE/Etk N-terminal domain-containing protein [Duganella phyllosphaerae]|uniref:Tyrosine-protein kinase etk n=1 Tax=Duganella phyllosphaerae TaxID=762836 RepID=A0A1E7WHK7_9BURK|nr:Wzz/FepE/Etk N-terminal domain-containing protein [Duganella phyllosphaerae]OEZ98115.1 tyrosine-protein kinase etk [Duganella phyllosphaerae]
MSEQLENKTTQYAAVSGAGDTHITDILIPLARQKKLVIAAPVVAACLALGVGLLIKPTFQSSAAILPPQQQTSSVASMLGQLGGLAGAAGGLSSALKNPNDLYVGMLQSRTIADNLITRFKLKERYEAKSLDEARVKLQKAREFLNGKDGLISIVVEDNDPKFAADLANAYVEELAQLTKGLAITEASRRRLFFEKQLLTAKDDLANAEVAMKKMQQTTGLLQLEGQVKGIIANEAQLQGLIAAKEVQLQSMRSFSTSSNPEYVRLQDEVRALNGQLSKLQQGKTREGDLMVPTGKLPEVGLEYIRSVRDVKYYETIFELLAKQFELAKIDEARDSSTIQSLDRAVPAEKKMKPKLSVFVMIGFLAGGLLGVLGAMARDAYLHPADDPASRARWNRLKSAWKR